MSFKPAIGVCFSYQGKRLMIKSISSEKGSEFETVNIDNKSAPAKKHSKERILELIEEGKFIYIGFKGL